MRTGRRSGLRGRALAVLTLALACAAEASRVRMPMGHYVRQAALIVLADTQRGGEGGHGTVVRILGERQSTGMESRMRESYGEGPASHTGPSRAPVPARAGAKRRPMGTCRQGIEPRNRTQTGVPTHSRMLEGHIERAAIARRVRTPRGQRPRACTDAPCAGTGRSHVRPRNDGREARTVNPKGARR